MCLIPGCINNKIVSKGLCTKHYNQQRKNSITTNCSVINCSNPATSKGFCNTHYQQQRKISLTATCSVIGCINAAISKGLCVKHNQQMRKYGKIKERTNRDRNETNTTNNITTMSIYNRKGETITETFFDSIFEKQIILHKWCMSGKENNKYVVTFDQNHNMIYLHHLIIKLSGQEVPVGKMIDHKDRNSLNNLLSNLRFCTQQQNTQNQSKGYSGCSSESKGVNWDEKARKWKAQISVNGDYIFLGLFDTEEEASKAYNEAAVKYFGEFAAPNIIKTFPIIEEILQKIFPV